MRKFLMNHGDGMLIDEVDALFKLLESSGHLQDGKIDYLEATKLLASTMTTRPKREEENVENIENADTIASEHHQENEIPTVSVTEPE